MRRLALVVALVLGACSGGGAGEREEPVVVDVSGSEESTAEDRTGPDHGGDDSNVVVGEDECETDADCVPAECCHAAACVGVANAPDCGDAMCTSDCRFGTLDCGGGCLCMDGRCAARLSQGPQIEVDPGPR